MSFRITAAAFAAVLLVAPASAQETVAPDTVIATVGDQEITAGHLLLARQRLPEQYQSLPDDMLFNGILEQLIGQAALAAGAGELNMRSAASLENERRALLAGQVLQAAMAGAVTEEAIQAAYEQQVGVMEPEQEFHAAHILLESEEEAQTVAEEVRGGADFAEVAKEKSTGPTGPNGGDLGWFSTGMMVPEFENAVLALEPGAISDPVQTQFGWHVIKLMDTREKAMPSLDELRPQIANDLQRAKMDSVMAEASANADITRPEEGAFDPSFLSDADFFASE